MLRHNSFHIYIAKKLVEDCKDLSYILERDKVKSRLWMQKIPITLHMAFIKELEDLGLVKQQGCRYILINKENIERFYFNKG